MIRTLCKTKWLSLTRAPTGAPSQSCFTMQLQSLKFLCTIISPHNHQYSFTVSDLINSPNTIHIPESRIAKFESSKRPNLVLKLLQDYNFTEIQVKGIVARWPQILLADPNKTLKPKIEFFCSVGISGPDIVKIFTRAPYLLRRSLKQQMVPVFDFLESVLGNRENAAKVFVRFPHICRVKEFLSLNIATLRNFGVPDSQISKLIISRPKVAILHPDRFIQAASTVKEMGFNPKVSIFGLAVVAVGLCSKSTWGAKFDVYRSYGLSTDEILAAFKKQPMSLMLKEKKLRATMDFFVKKLHWSPLKVLTMPDILLLSLEGRTIPRFSVLHVLVSRKLLKRNSSIQTMLKMTEKNFVEKYVTKYQDEPQVLDAYQGRLKIDEFNIILEETGVCITL